MRRRSLFAACLGALLPARGVDAVQVSAPGGAVIDDVFVIGDAVLVQPAGKLIGPTYRYSLGAPDGPLITRVTRRWSGGRLVWRAPDDRFGDGRVTRSSGPIAQPRGSFLAMRFPSRIAPGTGTRYLTTFVPRA